MQRNTHKHTNTHTHTHKHAQAQAQAQAQAHAQQGEHTEHTARKAHTCDHAHNNAGILAHLNRTRHLGPHGIFKPEDRYQRQILCVC